MSQALSQEIYIFSYILPKIPQGRALQMKELKFREVNYLAYSHAAIKGQRQVSTQLRLAAGFLLSLYLLFLTELAIYLIGMASIILPHACLFMFLRFMCTFARASVGLLSSLVTQLL